VQSSLRRSRLALAALLAAGIAGQGLVCVPEPPPVTSTPVTLPGLQGTVRVVVDRFGSPHFFAENDFDLARVVGYVQARDRFWQMDTTRREASGDLAELLGPSAVSGDVQNRTIGLRRAAVRSAALLSAQEQALAQSYADGVNHWLATNPLPPEYAQLELTTARPWDVIDSLVIGKAIATSLSLDIDAGLVERLDAFVKAGQAATPPYDGRKLLFEDVQRFAPMDPAATVPDADGTTPWIASLAPSAARRAFVAAAAKQARALRERLEGVPNLAVALDRRASFTGSNEWGVTASASETGKPMIANDPHLSLGAPSTFYEMHLVVSNDPIDGPMNVHGIGFPGVPFVILGQNEKVTWGATTNPMDVSDLFRDRFVSGSPPGCPATACAISGNELYPLKLEVADYRANTPGDGQIDNVVDAGVPIGQKFILTIDDERRSYGPIVQIDDAGAILGNGETHGLVLQFTGFHATRELQTFRAWNRARSLPEFLAGLESFDFGSQNWAYADSDGNLGYFASAEMPLRKDLENGAVVGLPPYFVRDGESGENNWVYDPARSQGQSIPFAILPASEMPQTLNPRNGFFANANNDPAGTLLDNDPLNQHRPSKPTAIYYLSGGYADGLRAGRITRLVEQQLAQGKVSVQDLKEMQGNTQELDAELLVPHLLGAFANASAPGAPPELALLAADPGVAEAISRLAAWDYSTPTGIVEGYDQSDDYGTRLAFVPPNEASASVAATLFNVWRGRAIAATIDATLVRVGAPTTGAGDALVGLHHLLSQAPFTGVGASGVDFFPQSIAAGASAGQRRDVVLLRALRTALDALASPAYAAAFAGSTSQDDYRWGKLHRITFRHRLGAPYSIPPAAGFTDLAAGLTGLARDGGYEVVNASSYGARGNSIDAFKFGGGPVRRYVGTAGAVPLAGVRVAGWNVTPGGSRGDYTSPLYAKQLGDWLTADQHPVMMTEYEALRGNLGVETFASGAGVP
jgi:penicillin amidase